MIPPPLPLQRISPAVAILPYGKKLGISPGRLSTCQFDWPLGMPGRLQGCRLSDLAEYDHLLIHPRSSHYYRLGFGTQARVSIWVLEPEIYHRKHVRKLKTSFSRFFRILTAIDELIAAVPNGVLVPFGSTWIPNWRDVDCTKHRMTSLIASEKAFLPLHRLRHEMAAWVRGGNLDVDVIGRGYKPFAHKWEGLAPYRFSIVIENAIQPNYFTEKLIDAILCDTIPIYLGCPNIEKYIDPKGMIICNSMGDLQNAVCRTSVDLYDERIADLRKCREQALYYADCGKRAAQRLLTEAMVVQQR